MSITGLFGRRSVLKAGALLGGLSALLSPMLRSEMTAVLEKAWPMR
jgi:hypothetical protein